MTALIVDRHARGVIEPTLRTLTGRTPLNIRVVAALPTNKTGPVRLTQSNLVIDALAHSLADPDRHRIGRSLWVHRLVYAQRKAAMPVTKRYTPELAPGETSVFGMNFDAVIPAGVGIASGTLIIFNHVDGINAGAADDVTAGPVQVLDRTLYATVTAIAVGPDGIDYGLQWTATDTDGNVWPRTALVLCAQTS